MKRKLLIMGIESFTGKHLSLFFKNLGYDVYGTSLANSSKKIYKCDITFKEKITEIIKDIEPDYLINLAGISFVAHNNNNDFYRINSVGAINILEACVKANHKPKKIIMVSSASVYGNQGVETLDESLYCKPINHYGASKLSMESVSSAFFQKLNILIVRPFNYTGIGQSDNFLIPKIINHYRNKSKTIELGNTNVSREFNDIEFICQVYRKLLVCDATSKIVNIASGRGVQLLSVIQHMNKIAKYEINLSINQSFVRKNEINNLVGSSDLLFDLIGVIEQKDFSLTLGEMYEA
ncbi:NAD-dependent epimerase/dehydratase family protein [Candidatus Pseudothioglobus sp. Uisw_086]|uniref:NAD-dependent epimerase/dehydratase family protein n=1 Tax=Candidatus Pseudothioglobus sp. Uisw_086 TaxID=3230998 RepID=UPI003A8B95B6